MGWPMVRTRRRGFLPGGRRRAGQHGAVAVETALLTPVLLVVLLGIIEVPMLIRDHVAVTSAARTGARVAAAEPGCIPKPLGPACPPPAPAPFGKLAADAVARNGTALSPESIRSVMVYKANADGYPGSLGSMPSSCAGITSCLDYTWNATAGAFAHTSGTWDRQTVNACFPSNVDAVGVQVIAEHKFLSGRLGASMTMSEHTVMNFEPLPVNLCASGSHK